MQFLMVHRADDDSTGPQHHQFDVVAHVALRSLDRASRMHLWKVRLALLPLKYGAPILAASTIAP